MTQNTNTAIDLKNHFCLQHANQLQKINAPLKLLGLDNFCFTSVDLHTSERFVLTDHPHWTQFAYNSSFYSNDIVKKIETDNIINFFLWGDFTHNHGFNAALQKAKEHGLKHGITFIHYTHDRANMYYASTNRTLETDKILLNIKDQLIDFIPYFHFAAKELISDSAKHAFMVRKNQVLELAVKKMEAEKLKLFYEAIAVKQLVINEQGDYLTHQETLCVYLSLRGKTSKQIAAALTISNRTVETHLFNVRKKLKMQLSDSLLGKMFESPYFNHVMIYGKRALNETNSTPIKECLA